MVHTTTDAMLTQTENKELQSGCGGQAQQQLLPACRMLPHSHQHSPTSYPQNAAAERPPVRFLQLMPLSSFSPYVTIGAYQCFFNPTKTGIIHTHFIGNFPCFLHKYSPLLEQLHERWSSPPSHSTRRQILFCWGALWALVSENVLEPILALVQAAFGLFQLISWWDCRKRPQGPKPWSLSWCCIRQIAQAVSQQREAA